MSSAINTMTDVANSFAHTLLEAYKNELREEMTQLEHEYQNKLENVMNNIYLKYSKKLDINLQQDPMSNSVNIIFKAKLENSNES